MMLFYGVYLISLPFKYNRPDHLRVAMVETTVIRSSQQLFLTGLWRVLMNIERKIAHIDAARMSAMARKRAKQTNQSHHIRKDKSFHFETFRRGSERCEVAAAPTDTKFKRIALKIVWIPARCGACVSLWLRWIYFFPFYLFSYFSPSRHNRFICLITWSGINEQEGESQTANQAQFVNVSSVHSVQTAQL